MVKKIIFLQVSLLLLGTAAFTQKPFTITGTIKGKNDGYIYLSYQKKAADDSAQISNGRFSFKGNLSGPVQATLKMDRNARFFDKYTQVYISPGNMQLTLDYNNFTDAVVLKGSPVQAQADKLNKLKAPVMAKIKPLSEAFNKANMIYIAAMKDKKDEATLDKLKDEAETAKDAMNPYYEQLQIIDKKFMDSNPASYLTATILAYSMSDMKVQEADVRFARLPDEIKNSDIGKQIKEDLESLRKGSPGAKATLFTSTELRGEPLSLTDYKGKYVLIDFWASWCVPCRAGNPHLLKLYTQYKEKGKGLEIIGIADDDYKPEAWKKAVEKDGTGVWKHVLRGLKSLPDYQFDRSNDISEGYGIHSLPTKVLVDPDGIIIGRYGGGGEDDDAMDKKLAEIFN